MENKEHHLFITKSKVRDFSLIDYMCDILNNFYEKNRLEHACALESLMGGNYNNEEQKAWLIRFGDVWDKVEKRHFSNKGEV
jgi:hypothetical protein